MRRCGNQCYTSDILFALKGQIFHGHLNILKVMAPNLARTLNLDEHDNTKPVPIDDIAPGIFQLMLQYTYGDTIFIADAETGKKSLVRL
jgi:hypothetical protein